MGSKDKIRQYIDFKELTNYEFEKKAKLTHGILKTGNHFRTDQLKQIRDNFPDLNMDWLIYDEGEMLLSSEGSYIIHEENDGYGDSTNYKEKYISLFETNQKLNNKVTRLQQKIIDLLENNNPNQDKGNAVG